VQAGQNFGATRPLTADKKVGGRLGPGSRVSASRATAPNASGAAAMCAGTGAFSLLGDDGLTWALPNVYIIQVLIRLTSKILRRALW
jgi:hypothetical protein